MRVISAWVSNSLDFQIKLFNIIKQILINGELRNTLFGSASAMKLTQRNLSTAKTRERIITSISSDSAERGLLDWFEGRAKVDGKSRSGLILDAMKEYRRRHWKGNPQTLLLVEGGPPAVDEARVEARTRQAVVFLRFKARLSYDQVAKVVGMSHGFVYKLCKNLDHLPDFDGRHTQMKKRRAKTFNKNPYYSLPS